MDRRSFLLRSARAMLSVYGAAALSPRHLEEGIAQAAAAAPPNQPVLVSIFLEGGWDGLSVLAPVKEAKYHELRPALGFHEGTGMPFSEDENLMWHPKAGGLAQLHTEDKVTVFPAIGYDRRVRGKMVGEFPGLAKLDPNENLVKTSDFRAMYAALLGQWFQTEAGLVIPEAKVRAGEGRDASFAAQLQRSG